MTKKILLLLVGIMALSCNRDEKPLQSILSCRDYVIRHPVTIVDSDNNPIDSVKSVVAVLGDEHTEYSDVNGVITPSTNYWGEGNNGSTVLITLSKGSETKTYSYSLVDCGECNQCRSTIPDTIEF